MVGIVLGTAAAQAFAADRVVLVSWDGIRRERLDALLHWQPGSEAAKACPQSRQETIMPELCNGEWSCLSALCRFQIIDSHVVEGKPLTRPQHAQMLSGYGPPETGVIANAGKRSLPPGYTIYERIKAVRPEVKTVHIAGRKFVGSGIIRWASDAGALDLDQRRGGRDNYTGAGTTEKFVEALDFVGNDPFFIFVHYKAADVVGHRAGDKRPSYSEAIVQNDLQLGGILDSLQERGLLNSTEIYVTTDHGFDGIFHTSSEKSWVTTTFLASRNPNLRSGPASVLDVTPTILSTLGVSMGSFTPPYRGVDMNLGPHP